MWCVKSPHFYKPSLQGLTFSGRKLFKKETQWLSI